MMPIAAGAGYICWHWLYVVTVNSRYRKPPWDQLEVSYNERFLILQLIFLYKFLRDRCTVAYIEKFLIMGVSYNESSLY